MGTYTIIATQLAYGVAVTLLMAIGAWLLAILPAIIVARNAATNNASLKAIRFFSSLLIILPFLALLFWAHYPLQEALMVVWDPFYTCTVLLATYIFFAVANLLAVELRMARIEHEFSAALLGLSLNTLIQKILFPLALIRAVPQILNLVITTIHMTMFGSLIGVEEIFRITLRLNAIYLKPVELFSLMAIVYAVICVPLFFLAKTWRHYLEKMN